MSPPKSNRRGSKEANYNTLLPSHWSEKKRDNVEHPPPSLDFLHISSDNNYTGTMTVALHAPVSKTAVVGRDWECVNGLLKQPRNI